MGRTFVREVMKVKSLKVKKEKFSVVLLGVSVVLGLATVSKTAEFFRNPIPTEELLGESAVLSRPDSNDAKAHFEQSKKVAGEIKEKNLFIPKPKKKNPVSGVSGIFGDSAFVNGKWCKVGDKVGDAELIAIEPTYVKIKWDGKERTYAPMMAAESSSKAERPRRRRPSREGRDEFRARGEARRAGMRERFQNMSEEEREKFRQERRRRREERGQSGGRRRGGGGGDRGGSNRGGGGGRMSGRGGRRR